MYFYVYKDRCDIAFIMRINESACNAGDPGLIPGSGRSLKKERLPTAVFYGFPGGSDSKASACSAGDPGSVPGLRRFSREWNGNTLQYSCLEQSMGSQRVRHDWATSRSCSRSCWLKLWFFPAVMYGCESWTIKKTECWRIDAFELWCWRRLLRVPWTARRSNHSILKEVNPEYSLEGLMLKLKLQYFGHLMRRTDSLEKTEGGRRRGRQRMRWLDGITD